MWYTPWHFNKEHDGTAWNSPMYGFDDGIPFLILPEISAGDWRICTLRGCWYSRDLESKNQTILSFFLQNASYSIISKLLWVCLGHRKSCENHRQASSAVWIDPYRSISIAGHKHHKLRCLSWQLFGWMKARTCGDALGLVEGRICRKLWEFIDYGFLLLSQWKQTLCSRFAPTYCM